MTQLEKKESTFNALLTNRRTVRQYTEAPIEKASVDLLVEAALRSPSSRGLFPWQFVVVQDKALIEQLAKSKPHGAAFLKNAPCCIVICGDPKVCDVWVEDCAIAATNVFTQAEDLGLGACWIQIRKRFHGEGQTASDWVKSVLGLERKWEVAAIIAFGYPTKKNKPHLKEKLLWDRVLYR